jgi:hypothetical protein
MLWPEGPGRELQLRGRARDLRTADEGAPEVIGEAELSARIDYAGDRKLVEIDTTPEEPRLERLLGARTSTGFRALLDEAVPDQRDARTLAYLLLDDVPVTALVGGYAIGAALGEHTPMPVRKRPALALQHPDLCAGWAKGATIMHELETSGRIPVVTGPAAPSLARDGDPHAWHALEALPEHAMRRHRRLDLIADGNEIGIDVLFRDSHMAPGAEESIVHEYTVRARIDRESLTIREIEARPQVLPWLECPRAAESARELGGQLLEGLRPHVRNELTGKRTCTHLNDTLRSLEDVIALVEAL